MKINNLIIITLLLLTSCASTKTCQQGLNEESISSVIERCHKQQIDPCSPQIACRPLSTEEFIQENPNLPITPERREYLRRTRLYKVYVENAPAHTVYRLAYKNMLGNIGLFPPEKFLTSTTNFTQACTNFGRGEYVDIILLTQDLCPLSSVHIVPYPIEAIGKNGQKVSVRPVMLQCKMNIIELSGFQPNEEVLYTSISEGEVITAKIPINCSGEATAACLPFVKGLNYGTVTIEVYSEVSNEKLQVSFDWGIAP